MRLATITGFLTILLFSEAPSAEELSAVVLRVGQREITRAEFDDGFSRFLPDTSSGETDARGQYLEALIDRHLLIQEARDQNLFVSGLGFLDFEVEIENEILREVRNDETRSKVAITDNELRDYYDRHAVLYDISQILLATRDEADEVLRAIRSGASFEELARAHSVDAKSRKDGGRLTPFIWSATSPEFMVVLSRLKPGEISEPFLSDYGYHIFRLNALVPREQGSFEEEKEFLRSRLSIRKQGELQAGLYDRLEARYNFEPHLDTAIELAAIYAHALDRAEQEAPGADDENVAREAKLRVVIPSGLDSLAVATSDFGDYTVRQHWEHIRAMPNVTLVDRRNPHQIVNDAASDFLGQAMVLLARDQGLQYEPHVHEAVESRLEEISRALLVARLGETATAGEANRPAEDLEQALLRDLRKKIPVWVDPSLEPPVAGP